MNCEICNKDILDNSQYINGKYYHNDCIEQLQQENARLKDKLNDIQKILKSNHDVEYIYCALSQYLNIFDYELDLKDYLEEN